jgi:hypothetical protein
MMNAIDLKPAQLGRWRVASMKAMKPFLDYLNEVAAG